MFRLRTALREDTDALVSFANEMNFINLPKDKSEMEKKIANSLYSFHSPKEKLEENNYIFVLEDLDKNHVVGCSMIHGKHGTPEKPHLFLKIGREERYSHSLDKTCTYRTLQFGHQKNGYSEIGGLFLAPAYRGDPHKLGKQLSYIRFLYMGLYRQYFTEVVHVELMPPLDEEGNSPLWKALGKRFLSMNYKEVDTLSRKNKEFILSLFPSQVIYEALLPNEAKTVVGKVGRKTLPVKKMLENIGFSYTNEIDPLDGGPHYRACLNEITLIKKLKKLSLTLDSSFKEGRNYMAMALDHPCLWTLVVQGRIEDGKLITKSIEGNIKNGERLAVIPF